MNNQWKFFLDNIKESTKEEPLKPNDEVLMIDSMNTFLRCFAVINQVNPSGDHTGGLTGFIKSIGYAVRLVKPTKVILVFDGQGSSTNKRYLFPEYKANRNIQQIKNWSFDSREEESEAMASQLIRIVDYMRCLPVQLLSIDKIEADDVMGYLATKFEGKVTIMSADRDFLQLVNDRVQVYSPTKKKFYKDKEIHEEFGVHAKNFIYYKTLLGDKGDNIPGVKGLGPVKLFKLFPELGEDKELSLKDILDKCEENKDKHPLYQDILLRKLQLELNFKLMNLSQPNIPDSDLETVESVITNSNKNFDKSAFIQMYNEDKLGESIRDVASWVEGNFRYLTAF